MSGKNAPRVSWILLVVLVVAVATGAAASILVSASTVPPRPSPSSLVYLPGWVVTVLSVALIVFIIGSFVVWRITAGPSSNLTRMALTVLVVVLLGTFFILGAKFLGAGNWIGPGGYTPSNGGVSAPGQNSTNVTGSTHGPGGNITWIPGLPGWVPIVLIFLVVVLVVVIGVPRTREYLAERHERSVARRRIEGTVPPGMRDALARASTDLDLGGDPRTVILALYAAMLAQLRPMVDNLPTSTPEEIRATHLLRLGVRPEAARTLTRLFEEARYSTHPMGPEESARAREAVRATLDDLSRRTQGE